MSGVVTSGLCNEQASAGRTRNDMGEALVMTITGCYELSAMSHDSGVRW